MIGLLRYCDEDMLDIVYNYFNLFAVEEQATIQAFRSLDGYTAMGLGLDIPIAEMPFTFIDTPLDTHLFICNSVGWVDLFTTVGDVCESSRICPFLAARPQFDSVHHQNRMLSSHSYCHESVIFPVFLGLIL